MEVVKRSVDVTKSFQRNERDRDMVFKGALTFEGGDGKVRPIPAVGREESAGRTVQCISAAALLSSTGDLWGCLETFLIDTGGMDAGEFWRVEARALLNNSECLGCLTTE